MKNFTRIFRRHFNPHHLMLYLFLGILCYVLAQSVGAYIYNDFAIPVVETKNNQPDQKLDKASLTCRIVKSELNFRSGKFLDYLFVDKEEASGFVQVLLSLFFFIQLLRVNYLWRDQQFTAKLYRNLDALSLIGTVMFIYSGLQRRYLTALVTRLTGGAAVLEEDFTLLIIAGSTIVFSVLLKGFAKRGNDLQQDNELTI